MLLLMPKVPGGRTSWARWLMRWVGSMIIIWLVDWLYTTVHWNPGNRLYGLRAESSSERGECGETAKKSWMIPSVTYRYSEPIPWAICAPSLGPKWPMPWTKHALDQIPIPQTKHASDQTAPCPGAMCLRAMARNSHSPLRPKRHILVPLCFSTLFLVIIVFIILSLSIVIAYYCLPITTIYSPLYT